MFKSTGVSGSSPKVARFTVVELVIVMVVLLLLMGISLGTLRTVAKANLVEATARDLGSELHVTRQLAIARRRYVACILPGGESGLKAGQMYHVYRQAYVKRAGADCTFESWVDGSSWNYTRTGVCIMEADEDMGIQNAGVYTRTPKDTGYAKVDDVDLGNVLGGGGSVSNVRAVVFAPNGRLFGNTRFITVGRAQWDGTKWFIDTPASLPKNQSCADQMTIEINRFTGGISYLNIEDY